MGPKRIALVHNWLTVRGGSENVLFELCKMYPDAPIYTLVYDAKKFPELKNRTVKTSWLQHIPWLRWRHEFFPPIRYFIWRFTYLRNYDLVITSSSSENKAIRTPGACHIAYIHTPPHYYWRYHEEYLANPGFGKLNPIARLFLRMLNPVLRKLDYKSAQNPDLLLANSKFIASQVKKYYKRDSTVLYPPVSTNRFAVGKTGNKSFYLTFGRQTVFKHFDLIVRAFNELALPLKIAGIGPEHENLKKIAEPNIEFLGFVPDDKLANLVAEAQACVFANEEDFGITWVESTAAGTPVICYGSGGALETVVDGITGVLFSKQTTKSLLAAVEKSQTIAWDRTKIKAYASRFSKQNFIKEFESYTDKEYKSWVATGAK